jgi:hypothetical protein
MAPERVRVRLGQSGQLNFSVIPDCTAPMPGTVGDYVVQTDTGDGTASEVITLSGITTLPALAEAWCELGVVAALSQASSAANGSWLRAEYTLQNASAETAVVTLEHGWQPRSITVKPGTPAVLKVIAPDGCRGDANLTATATFVSGSDQAVRFEPLGRQVCQ